ncbi:uncharacterized protein LOC127793267 isoform X2 [Diospyros lotus]|uniref:uncharacterized protein LOC127793267 isoform X2 n=1 Tax=Diospyros lotus TaxID=55363 RepID=UPI00224E24D0|nr:uncharacterized protein LOC127793267 isoform X2 [Diospyros lotus]
MFPLPLLWEARMAFFMWETPLFFITQVGNEMLIACIWFLLIWVCLQLLLKLGKLERRNLAILLIGTKFSGTSIISFSERNFYGSSKPDLNIFKSHDNPEMEGCKLEKETNFEGENKGTWHLGRQQYYQLDSDSFLESKGNRDAARNLMELNGFVAGDDPSDGRGEHTALYAKSQLEPSGWREDRTSLYRDVHVVFPRESIQVVQGVCINKEISYRSKCSIENCRLDDDSICVLLNSYMDMYSKPTEEAPNTVSPVSSTASESVPERDGANDSMKIVMDQKEALFASIKVADDGSNKKNVSGSSPMVEELGTNYCRLQLTDSTRHKDEEQDNKVGETSEGAMLATSMPCAATDASHKNCYAMESDSKCDAESRRLIYDYASTATMSRGSERSLKTSDLQPAPKIVETCRLDNEMSESLRVSSQTYYSGESSFPALDPLSGPIEQQSGPLSYSGSISHRSNSSNSTRSFAFPILPSEWNGSPVKMAEADRRQLKKGKGWRVVFLCCEF